jgi:hypothetical protein
MTNRHRELATKYKTLLEADGHTVEERIDGPFIYLNWQIPNYTYTKIEFMENEDDDDGDYIEVDQEENGSWELGIYDDEEEFIRRFWDNHRRVL